MTLTYLILGFNDYIIKDKILYRKRYKIKTKSGNIQYRRERKINKTSNNGIIGYILVRNNKRKFYSLTSLRHRLKKSRIMKYTFKGDQVKSIKKQ